MGGNEEGAIRIGPAHGIVKTSPRTENAHRGKRLGLAGTVICRPRGARNGEFLHGEEIKRWMCVRDIDLYSTLPG